MDRTINFHCGGNVTCDSGKIIKSDSSAPTSNLKKHISKCHPETLSSFLTLRDCNKLSIPSNTVFIQEI